MLNKAVLECVWLLVPSSTCMGWLKKSHPCVWLLEWSHLILNSGIQICEIFSLDVEPSHSPKTIEPHGIRPSHPIQLHPTNQTHPYNTQYKGRKY